MLKKLGNRVISLVEEMGGFGTLVGHTLTAFFKGSFRGSHVLSQMVRVGVDSLPITFITMASVGMVFSFQIAKELTKYGAGNMAGALVGISLARELAPMVTAVVIAAYMGAAIAAEIGSMKVTEQIDALYALASDPVEYLVVPRFLACTFMLPLLTIFANIVGFLGGYMVAVGVVGVNPVGFLNSAQTFVKLSDMGGGMFKALVFGVVIAMVSCYRGLSAQGGAQGVGKAATSAVVISMIAIFVGNYFLSMLLFT